MPGERDQKSISNESSSIQASVDLPCLPIGCSVSAKYRGAFCSAQVKSIDKQIKVKVKLIESGETLVISDENIVQENSLRLGNTVTIRSSMTKNHQKKQAIIKQITDNSIYTVVFNDGDETSLRRASLCLKGIRLYQNHIGQSKTSQKKFSPSTSNVSIESTDAGSIVCVRRTLNDEKKTFPALILKRKALPDYLWVRSFLDGKEYVVHQHHDIQPYRNNSEMQNLCRLTSKQATQACERFIRYQQIPSVWQRKRNLHQSSFDSTDDDFPSTPSEDEDNEDETTDEKGAFLAKLLDFMDNRGSPINNIPKIQNYDLDLHRLFKIVLNFGGSNKVTKNDLWNKVHRKMGLPEVSGSERGRAVEQAFRKYLFAFENLTKKLGTSDVHFGIRTKSTADSRRSLAHRRSQTCDENEKTKKKSTFNFDRRARRSSSSSASDKSEKRPTTKRTNFSPKKSANRSISSIVDDPKLSPIIKIPKISSETLDEWSLNNNEQDSSSESVQIESNVGRQSSSSVVEVPSIFQTLLFSTNEKPSTFSPIINTTNRSRNSSSSSSSNGSESNDDFRFATSRLKYDEISVNDQLLIRENENNDDLQYAQCIEKNDETQKIFVRFQLDDPSNEENQKWIPMSRVLQRQLIVQVDQIRARLSTSNDDEKPIEIPKENFRTNSDSETTIFPKRSTPLKRRYTRESRLSKDSSVSLRSKNKNQPDFSLSQDEIFPVDGSPISVNKKQKLNPKRNGKRTIQRTENSNHDGNDPLNHQLRQRLEEMFKNRTSRYNFLDLDENFSGDQRFEHLRDRLRQCQKVFFNLQLALTKIETEREIFLKEKVQTKTKVEN